MENPLNNNSSCRDISQQFDKFVKFRQSYITLHDQFKKLLEENFSLKKMLKMVENLSKQDSIHRKSSENIIAKQKTIIENLVNVKDENIRLKKELENAKEDLKNSYKEMDQLRNKTADEITVVEEAKNKELDIYRQQYILQENQMKESFDEERCNLNTIIYELKQTIEILNNEKNAVVALTIKEYEEQIKLLKDALNGSKMELKILNDRNNETFNFYQKNLEDQKNYYTDMLEKIQMDFYSREPENKLIKNKPEEHNIKTNLSAFSNKQIQIHRFMVPNLLRNSTVPSPLLKNTTSNQLSLKFNSKNINSPVNSSYYKRLRLPPPHWSNTNTSGSKTEPDYDSIQPPKPVNEYSSKLNEIDNDFHINHSNIDNRITDNSNNEHFEIDEHSNTESKISSHDNHNSTRKSKRRKLCNPKEMIDLIESFD